MTGAKSAKKALDEANNRFESILKKWGYLK